MAKTIGAIKSDSISAYDYAVADAAGRGALTGMTVGETIFQRDSGETYVADSDTTAILKGADLSKYASYNYVVNDVAAKDALTGLTDGETIFIKADGSLWKAAGGTGNGSDAITDSVDTSKMGIYDYVVDDAAGRGALTGMTVGQTIFQKDNGKLYTATSATESAEVTSSSSSISYSAIAGEDITKGDTVRLGDTGNISIPFVVPVKEEFDTLDGNIWETEGGSVDSSVITITGNDSYKRIYSKNTVVGGDFDITFKATINKTDNGIHYIGFTEAHGCTGNRYAFSSLRNYNDKKTYICHNNSKKASQSTTKHDGAYHIWGIKRSGNQWTYSIDGTDVYTGTGTTADMYFGTQTYNSGTKVEIDYINYETHIYEETAKIYKTSASDVNRINLLGYSNVTGTSGTEIEVNVSGLDTNQSGLVAGEDYFLQDTPGTIGTSRGTNIKYAGVGINGNTINIKKLESEVIIPNNYYTNQTATTQSGTLYTESKQDLLGGVIVMVNGNTSSKGGVGIQESYDNVNWKTVISVYGGAAPAPQAFMTTRKGLYYRGFKWSTDNSYQFARIRMPI